MQGSRLLLLLGLVVTPQVLVADITAPFKTVLDSSQMGGLKEYLAVIGMDANVGLNKDISRYNSNLLANNNCFRKLAGDFYTRENIFSSNQGKAKIPEITDSVAVAGDAPGAFWKRALAASGGNKNLAMMIIGMCGHDDKVQISGGQAQLLPSDTDLILQRQHLLAAGKYSAGPNGCPVNSAQMFYPKSLGETADITSALKNKVVKWHKESVPSKPVPAKYYHSIGAAYTSCYLVHKKIPNWVARKIVSGAANAYRAGRFCDEIKSYPEYNEKWTVENTTNLIKTDKNEIDPKLKKVLQEYDLLHTSRGDNELAAQVKSVLGRLYAYSLFRRSPQYTLSRECSGPQFLPHVRTFFNEQNSESPLAGQCAKNNNLCFEARRLMTTWSVDFEWTEAQHLAGFNFAQENCEPLDSMKEIEAASCKLLESSQPYNEEIPSEKTDVSF